MRADGKPNIYGSIFRFEGQASVFATGSGPCYRCLFRDPPPAGLIPNCAEAGVLGVLPGLIGTIQATETLKLILRIGEPLIGRLLLVESLAMTFRTIKIRRDPSCPACGTDVSSGGERIRSLADRAQGYAEVVCDTGTGPESSGVVPHVREITPAELAEKVRRGDDFDLIDVREPRNGNWGDSPARGSFGLAPSPLALERWIRHGRLLLIAGVAFGH